MHPKGFNRSYWVAALALVSALAIAIGWWWRCGAPTTLLIVRHADRAGTRDELDAAGVLRARELVRVLERAGISAVYHSNTVRARDTAAPLALALGLIPVERKATDVSGLVDAILDDHRGQHVFVVGHSNTVPQLIQAAGGPALPDLEHAEYDQLFVLTRCGCWPAAAQLVRLQYGATSP